MVDAVIGVVIESIVGFDDVDGISDPIDWSVINEAVTWEWLSRVLNKSGRFEMDEVVEYWLGLVGSCDEKGDTVGDVTKIVAAVLSVWLFVIVFSGNCDGEFWLGTIEGIGLDGRLPLVCEIVAAYVPMVPPSDGMPVCVLFEDTDRLWFRRICEDCVGRKLSVFCCSVTGEGMIGCEAGELFTSLLSAVVGTNDPFSLGIVDERFAEGRVSRACWTVMNDGVVNTEPDDTFICVSLKEDTKLWFGRIDDAGIGWKVLPVGCPVTDGRLVVSDKGEILVDVLFVDKDRLWFKGVNDDSAGKLIFEGCCSVTDETCVNIES